MEIVVLWKPYYLTEGVFKALTAVASVITAVLLWRLMPVLVAMPRPQELNRLNAILRAEIGERKRIEEDLAEAQRIARLGHWQLDLTSGIASWSAGFYRIIERPEGEIRPDLDDFLGVVHPDDRGMVRDAFRAHFVHGEPCALEHRLLLADGRIKYVQQRWDMEGKTAGKCRCSLGTLQDITERKEAEIALRQAKMLLDSIVENIPVTVYLKRAGDLRFELFNRAAEILYDCSREEILGRTDYDCFPKEKADSLAALDRAVLAGGQAMEFAEESITTRSGKRRIVSSFRIGLRDPDGNPSHLLVMAEDITDRLKAEQELRLAFTVFNASSDAILVTDPEEQILSVNPAFTEITGYTLAELRGGTPRILSSGRMEKSFYEAMWDKVRATGRWQGEIWDRRKDGTIYPKWLSIAAVHDAVGRVTHYVGIFTDITERREYEEQIRKLAFFDPLTKLPNRRLLADRLEQALAASARTGALGALLFMDLDNFKALNDTLGHDFGDTFLIEAARRIRSSTRETDTVARLGGDEFVIVLESLGKSHGKAVARAGTIGQKILGEVGRPYLLPKLEHQSSASIGATIFSGHDVAVEELLRRADTAMYEAKKAGRGTLRFFDPVMQKTLEERIRLEMAMRRALQKREFHLCYQLQVDGNRQPVGVEALLRWDDPEHGSVPPGKFIPLAEETGLILPIGEWVLEEACARIEAWTHHPVAAALTVAVNVSARQFRQPDFVGQVRNAVARHGIDPSRLKLELTESLVIHDVADAVDKMNRLKAFGVSFSMDDFGTGYSSLSQLKRLPLAQIKIDRSFVDNLPADNNDAAIVQTILSMGHALGLEILAEGVENEQQLAFLTGTGCRLFQGYLFGHPLPAAVLERLLEKGEGGMPS